MEEKQIRILNVEDENVDHVTLVRFMKERGLPYDVERAGTLADASELLKKNSYDVVFLDYRLPDGTGLDLLEKVKDMPSIFITGSGDEVVAVHAMKGGAYDYIIKDPVGGYLEILPTAVEKSLYLHRLKKEREEMVKRLETRLDEEKRLNNLLLKRELRIKELKDENERLKKMIEELKNK
jgi:DNA-binding NtrC family response regulator